LQCHFRRIIVSDLPGNFQTLFSVAKGELNRSDRVEPIRLSIKCAMCPVLPSFWLYSTTGRRIASIKPVGASEGSAEFGIAT
jgi:hypothetical protein